MKTEKQSFILSILFIIGISQADTTIAVHSLNYSVYLPDNWILDEKSDTQHVFYDTTYAYHGLVSIVRYKYDKSVYPTGDDWSRASFIAYMLVAEYSWDPWGAILYCDSSALSKQQDLWAPEAYAQYYTLDTALDAWAEYIRYPASGEYGYDLYAISDTTDLAVNIGFYAAIIQLIRLEDTVTEIISMPDNYLYPQYLQSQNRETTLFYDLLGRKISVLGDLRGKNRIAAGVYTVPTVKIIHGAEKGSAAPRQKK
jgi:hypothetical protein